MSQKIAVAVIHGIGKTNPEFNDPNSPKYTSGIAKELKSKVAKQLGKQDEDAILEVEAIYWAPILQDRQDTLDRNLQVSEKLSSFFGLRDFVFHSLADSVAYQTTSSNNPSDRFIYDEIHNCFAKALKNLADRAGTKAPLCIIAHSLGSVIASNYIWDLQKNRIPSAARTNPLEQGETLALFYTFGSQIAFWSLRHKEFGEPIKIPSEQFSQHYSGIEGEWVNFYDRNDLLGYPIKSINDEYKKAVKADIEVQAGNIVKNWNPLSHNEYWTDDDVTKPIAQSLAKLWKSINPTSEQ